MSIRTNPEKAVPLLLKRLRNTIQNINVNDDDPLVEKINKIESNLNEMEDLLLDHFTKILDVCPGNVDSQTINSMLDHIDAEITNIKNSVSLPHQLPLTEKATVADERTPRRGSEHEADQGRKDRRGLSELEEKILVDTAMANLKVSYDHLDRIEQKLCLLFLSIFPENAVLKKRPLIYWWIGEGLIKREEEGEHVFQELLKVDLIKPYFEDKCPIVNKYQLHPWIRYMLISLAKNAQLFDFDSKGIIPHSITHLSRRACLTPHVEILPKSENLRTIFNIDESYIDFSTEWIANLKKLVVLQLGRWQDSPRHHIEVLSEAFLKGLRTQKHLKYLSFRGISRISVLPTSIVELVNLEILDLKACHNLEILPPDIEPLRKLTHLDVSECYLLESMPKGLEKLSSLQVLKGFIIGDSKKTPCRIKDLKRLDKLMRLSIHIGSEAYIQDGEFDSLKDLRLVTCLKISWGVVSQLKEKVGEQSFSFPPSLEKLDLEGIPQDKLPNWLKPSNLKKLKKLYIKGGKLNSLDHQDVDRWRVEILRLKYLKNLKIALPKVKDLFPNLRYVLKREVTEEERPEDFEWSKDQPLDASVSRNRRPIKREHTTF